MPAVVRSPLLHFALLGAALFAAERLRVPTVIGDPIVISAARVRQLHDDYARTTNLTPTAADDRALVARAVDEELLYRDALARGLDRDDRSIRWQLAEKMRFIDGTSDDTRAAALGFDRDDPVIRGMLVAKVRLLVQDAVAHEPVTDDELREYLARHRDAFATPARSSFRHVFLSHARGGALDDDARRTLAALRAGGTVRGDAFPVTTELRAQTSAAIADLFGDDFAAALARAPVGEWSGPIASPFGLHLVRVDAVEPGAVPPLEAIRDRLLVGLRRERTERRLAERLAALRQAHVVRVDWPEGS